MKRSDRMMEEQTQIELYAANLQGLLKDHMDAIKRFKVIRAKHSLEFERQKTYCKQLQDKLFRVLDARRRALDFPKGSTTLLQFEKLRESSEQSLRTLRYELVDVKECLISEGVRLRNMHDEEFRYCQSELNRVRMLKEVVGQGSSIDQIIVRHRYSVLHLLEDLEKMYLVECEKDEEGLVDTVDDLGEQYIPHKVWNTPDIQTCTRTLETVMTKSNMTHELAVTAGNLNVNAQLYIALCNGVK